MCSGEHSSLGSPGMEVVVEFGMVWTKQRPARRHFKLSAGCPNPNTPADATLHHGHYVGAFPVMASLHS